MQGKAKFEKLLSQRQKLKNDSDKNLNQSVIISDGAMGTELMKHTESEYDTPLELNLRFPENVSKVHENYLSSGCNIINTNTFCANRLYLKKQGLEDKVEEINVKGVELAKKARADFLTNQTASQEKNKDIIITGSVGPTGSEKAIFLDDEDNKTRVKKAFSEQIDLLIKGGVDIITFETFSYHKELALAIEAVKEENIPYFVNMTFTNPTTTDYGSTVKHLAKLINQNKKENLLAAGINCITPKSDFRKTWKKLIKELEVQLPISILFNAGEPQLNKETGNMYYPEDENYYEEIKTFLAHMSKKDRSCIIGGCCGTNPKTITNLKDMIGLS